jgi:hypothetical protein
MNESNLKPETFGVTVIAVMIPNINKERKHRPPKQHSNMVMSEIAYFRYFSL